MRHLFVLIMVLATAPMVGCTTSVSSIDPAAAVNDISRSDTDRALDEFRKPADVLSFFQIETGMAVLDVFAGGGYYTEILSYLVGPTGSVTLYNNDPWDNFVKQQVDARLSDNRLPNVERLTLVPEALTDVDRTYDAAIFILGMHDLYYEDEKNGWPRINIEQFTGNLHRLIKPGGVLGIIDHNAAAGTDPEVVGESLHRVDPAVIVRDLEAAGFKLEASSDLLANPDDDLTGLVFSDALRWRSDRSVLRFRKPE